MSAATPVAVNVVEIVEPSAFDVRGSARRFSRSRDARVNLWAKIDLGAPHVGRISARRPADAPTAIVLAIDIDPRLRPAGEAPFLDWHTRLPYPSSLIRL